MAGYFWHSRGRGRGQAWPVLPSHDVNSSLSPAKTLSHRRRRRRRRRPRTRPPPRTTALWCTINNPREYIRRAQRLCSFAFFPLLIAPVLATPPPSLSLSSHFSKCVSRRSLLPRPPSLHSSSQPSSSLLPAHRTAPQNRARPRFPVRLRPVLPPPPHPLDRSERGVHRLLLCPRQSSLCSRPIPPPLDPRYHHHQRYQCKRKVSEHSVPDTQHPPQRLPTRVPRRELDQLYLSLVRSKLLVDI